MSKNERKGNKLLQVFRDNAPIVLQIMGVLVILANLWFAYKLAPIEQNMRVTAQEISELQLQLNQMQEQHRELVSKDEFNQVVTRIDHISTRVDAIYNIVATHK